MTENEMVSVDVRQSAFNNYSYLTIGNNGPRYRATKWPEGAPEPKDVPQAGERVTWLGKDYTVLSGQPLWSEEAQGWYIAVRTGDGSVSTIFLTYCQRIPPGPTMTVSGQEYLVSDVEKALSSIKPVR